MKHVSTEVCMGLPVRREVWTILGSTFDLTWPADMDALLDAPETHRRFRRDEYMPYWAQPWPASVLLAETVLRGAAGEGRPAIEVGCGVGLASVAAAMMGWSVTATDYDERATRFAWLNAERSGVKLVATRLLDYRVPLERRAYDLILASDLLYERRNAAPLAHWLATALHPHGIALLSDPNRSAADGFTDALSTVGLSGRVEPVETHSPAGLIIRGRVWSVRRSNENSINDVG